MEEWSPMGQQSQGQIDTGFSDRLKRVEFMEKEDTEERYTEGGKGLSMTLSCVCSFISTEKSRWDAGWQGRSLITSRIDLDVTVQFIPVKSGQDLSQKLTKTTVSWTGGRTEQQEAEEGLSMGNIKVSLSSRKTIFSL